MRIEAEQISARLLAMLIKAGREDLAQGFELAAEAYARSVAMSPRDHEHAIYHCLFDPTASHAPAIKPPAAAPEPEPERATRPTSDVSPVTDVPETPAPEAPAAAPVEWIASLQRWLQIALLFAILLMLFATRAHAQPASPLVIRGTNGSTILVTRSSGFINFKCDGTTVSCSWSASTNTFNLTSAGSSGATIPSVTNLIKGDGAGNGADSGIAPANVALTTGSYADPSWITSLAATKLTGTIAAARLPNPSSSSLGGVQSYAAVANQFIDRISIAGVPLSRVIALGDLPSGTLTTSAPFAAGASTGSLLVSFLGNSGATTANPYMWGTSQSSTTSGFQPMPVAGTIRNPYIYLSATQASGVVECYGVVSSPFYIANAVMNTPVSFCTYPASTAGVYGTGATTEYWHIPQGGGSAFTIGKMSQGGTAASTQAGAVEFVADSGYTTLLMAGDNGHGGTASTTTYPAMIGNVASGGGVALTNTDNLASALPMPFAGTLKNACIAVRGIPTANAVWTVEKIPAGSSTPADTSITVTVLSTDIAPAAYCDYTHTDTAAAGDSYFWKLASGASTQLGLASMSAAFTASSGTKTAVWFIGSTQTVSTSAKYLAAGGNGSALSTVATADIPMPFACSATNLYGFVDTQDTSSNVTTYTLEVNDADSALTGTTTSSTPVGSVLLDGTHTVAIAAGSAISLKWITNTGTSGKRSGFSFQCN